MNVYRMDDYHWFAGQSEEEAYKAYRRYMIEAVGEPPHEDDSPVRLTDEQMQEHTYIDDDGGRRTFREQLEINMAGPGRTQEAFMFAATDW